MNTELRIKVKHDSEKKKFKLMTQRHVREHRNVKLETADAKRNQLISKPKYPTPFFFRKSISIRSEK